MAATRPMLKDQILSLRKKGLTYDQICVSLGCAKSTVSYHVSFDSKQNTLERGKKRREQKPLQIKVERFLSREEHITCSKSISRDTRTVRAILNKKREQFSRTRKPGQPYNKYMFNMQELVDKIESNPVCYLTGRSIDLQDPSSYSLDHIIPRSKGGENTLENCGLACHDANQAKYDMDLEDFIELCKDVLINNGYSINGVDK